MKCSTHYTIGYKMKKGYQKLLKYLINLKVDVMWLQNNIPSTEAKQNDALRGLSTLEAWLYSLANENYNTYDKRTGKMVDVSRRKTVCFHKSIIQLLH